MMAATRRWYIDAEWIDHGHVMVRQNNTSFLVSLTATDIYTRGRRLKLIDGGTTILGEVLMSSVAAGNTTVSVSSSNLSASLSSGSVGILNPQVQSLPHFSHMYVRGLHGENLGGSTNIFTLSAASMVMIAADSVRTSPIAVGRSPLIADLTQNQTGSAAGQRDQATSFSNADIHFYAIWGADGISTLASLSGPNSYTGVTMPTDYSHLCYLWSQKMVGTSLTEVDLSGSWVYFCNEMPLNVSVSATSQLTLTGTEIMPAISMAALIHAKAKLGTGSTTTSSTAFQIRAVTGREYFSLDFAGNGVDARQDAQITVVPRADGEIYCLWSTNNPIGKVAAVYVNGYKVPNGGE